MSVVVYKIILLYYRCHHLMNCRCPCSIFKKKKKWYFFVGFNDYGTALRHSAYAIKPSIDVLGL